MTPVTDVPKSFLCTINNTVMKSPHLGDCGHLFDASVFETKSFCPLDGAPLSPDNCLSLPQLAEKINLWKNEKKTEINNSKKVIRPIRVLKNAHDDDIHGFLKLSTGVFVSGSKDNTVKLWDVAKKSTNVLNSNWKTKGYVFWVTALAKMNETTFVSGTRDGYLSVWNHKGEELKSLQYKPSKNTKNDTIAKERNKQRINCISSNTFGDQNLFFTGTPKFIQLWDSKTSRMRKSWKADNNDWVYCIEPLKEDSIIAVIGSRMELWSDIYALPKIEPLIVEKKEYNKQRPFISSIARLESNPDRMSCALFDGSMKVVNIVSQTVEKVYQEHVGRVWSVIELLPQIMASSADDKTIKIWDLRCANSVMTIRGAPGRVSSLLKIDDQQFISGSCPDNPRESAEKASISFWDIRAVGYE